MDDSVADVVAKMPRLHALDIGKNSSIGDDLVRRLAASSDLISLAIGGTKVSQKSFPSLAKMKRLGQLVLDNDVGISDLSELKNLPLTSISLIGCLITVNSPIVRQLSKFQKLESIRLSQTAIQDSDLLILAKLPNLKTLEIKYCDLLTPDGIRAFKKLKPACSVVIKDPQRASKFEKAESLIRSLDDGIK